MSDEGYNLFGAIAGGIGIVTVFPLLACWLLSQLPTAKMRELDQMLSDTESLLDSSVREGLLHGGNDFQPFRVRLWALLRTELSKLRVALVKHSSTQRRKLSSTGHLNNITYFAGIRALFTEALQGWIFGPFLSSDQPSGSDSGAEHHIVSAKDLQEVLSLVIKHQVRRRGSVSKRQRAVQQALLLRFGRRLFGSGAANGCPEGLAQMGHTQNNRIKAIRRFIQRTTEVHAHGFAAYSNEDGRRWEPLTTELVSDDECDGEEWHDV
ncbi:hypothetical protein BV20DRAFT_1103170 [Pilatotrama ljubarskyi]|nr:hypothetical protein BV20DRAFT_1103170 [Pilatotrama ljubarskyi]